MGLFIADGYTIDAVIKPHRGTPGLQFRYRPALPDQVSEYFYRHGRAANGKEQLDSMVGLLGTHVVSWSATAKRVDGTMESVPVNVEWLSKVPYPVLLEMRDEILSYGSGDAAEDDAKN